MREQLPHRRLFHFASREHHRNAIRVVGNHAEIVRNEQQRHRKLTSQSDQQIKDVRLNRHIERGGRLVSNQKTRPASDCHRDHHPLTLPAR